MTERRADWTGWNQRAEGVGYGMHPHRAPPLPCYALFVKGSEAEQKDLAASPHTTMGKGLK